MSRLSGFLDADLSIAWKFEYFSIFVMNIEKRNIRLKWFSVCSHLRIIKLPNGMCIFMFYNVDREIRLRWCWRPNGAGMSIDYGACSYHVHAD